MRWRWGLGLLGLAGLWVVWPATLDRSGLEPVDVTGTVPSEPSRQTPAPAAPFASRFVVLRNGSWVALTGPVASEEARAELVEQVRRALPDSDIADRTTVAPEASPDLLRAVGLAVDRLRHLDRGEVVVDDGAVVLSGEASDSAAYAAATTPLSGDSPPSLKLTTGEVLPPVARPFRWTATRTADSVTLSGFAPSGVLRDAPAEAGRQLFPDLARETKLAPARGLPDAVDFAEATHFALAQLAALRNGTVEIVDASLALEGEADTEAARGAVEAAARAGLPRGLTLARLAVTTAPPPPYTFTARRAAGTLRLAGLMPTVEARDALKSAARRRFFGEQIVDETRVAADGAPERFAAAALNGLDHLAQLAQGELRLQGTALTLTGESLYGQLAEQMRGRVAATVPSGWSATAEVRARGAERTAAVAACQAAVNNLLAGGGLSLAADAGTVRRFAELAAARCPQARFEVGGFVEPGAEEALERSRRRAQEVADRLVEAGLPISRVAALGRGESKAKDGKPDAASPRAIEILVKP